ncbi:MAG: PQQ-dependent sugar dehydrogenase [Pseudomonadota bacterium]|nr:PQQ-dependent sugar dehydrogenase [Pseudomonadota bacterium]
MKVFDLHSSDILGNLSQCLGLVFVTFLFTGFPVTANEVDTVKTSIGRLQVEKMAAPFNHPWSIAFLPNARGYLVTERIGKLRLVRNGIVSPPIEGLPKIKARGQGGLLDLAVDPDFRENNLIYFTFSEPVSDYKSRTSLAKGRLSFRENLPLLENVTVIFRQYPPIVSDIHFGSRISISNNKKIFVTLGDRGEPRLVQKLSNHLGKVVRINNDGSSPDDNPFKGRSGALPEIWSYGHRNPQGAAIRKLDNRLFTVSHGAAGGDEVNLSIPGKNFGWPEVSYGTHYSGRAFQASVRPDVIPPLHFWDPSIAPSGATIYDGALFPEWSGNLFIGALRGKRLVRLKLKGNVVEEKEQLLVNQLGRIRDVRTGPDGAIWFTIDDENGAVYRIHK